MPSTLMTIDGAEKAKTK